MKNIVLIGFMGTGKTVLAEKLASELDMQYVSIDDRIEASEGKKISNIFEEDGEAYFRQAEKRVLKEIMSSSGQVVDTGGGVVLDEENMRVLEANGIVICLWAEPEVVYERTRKHGHRPLLNVDDPLKKIKELMEYRKPFYKKAEHHIDTTAFEPDRVIERIKEIIDGSE